VWGGFGTQNRSKIGFLGVGPKVTIFGPFFQNHVFGVKSSTIPFGPIIKIRDPLKTAFLGVRIIIIDPHGGYMGVTIFGPNPSTWKYFYRVSWKIFYLWRKYFYRVSWKIFYLWRKYFYREWKNLFFLSRVKIFFAREIFFVCDENIFMTRLVGHVLSTGLYVVCV
jgi:hypothetical protein